MVSLRRQFLNRCHVSTWAVMTTATAAPGTGRTKRSLLWTALQPDLPVPLMRQLGRTHVVVRSCAVPAGPVVALVAVSVRVLCMVHDVVVPSLPWLVLVRTRSHTPRGQVLPCWSHSPDYLYLEWATYGQQQQQQQYVPVGTPQEVDPRPIQNSSRMIRCSRSVAIPLPDAQRPRSLFHPPWQPYPHHHHHCCHLQSE